MHEATPLRTETATGPLAAEEDGSGRPYESSGSTQPGDGTDVDNPVPAAVAGDGTGDSYESSGNAQPDDGTETDQPLPGGGESPGENAN